MLLQSAAGTATVPQSPRRLKRPNSITESAGLHRTPASFTIQRFNREERNSAGNLGLEHGRQLRAGSVDRSLTNAERMAGTTRLELATSAVTGQRSNQLNYVPAEGNQ